MRPGETVSLTRIGNRFTIREVKSRFREQTAFFVHDAADEPDAFHGPFWSDIQAMERIKEIERCFSHE